MARDALGDLDGELAALELVTREELGRGVRGRGVFVDDKAIVFAVHLNAMGHLRAESLWGGEAKVRNCLKGKGEGVDGFV